MENNVHITCRPMTADDLDAVMDVQHDAYAPFFFEKREVFANKLALFPSGCWVCAGGKEVAAYLVSHPSLFSSPPALNREMDRLPDAADCYYVHDLAIRSTQQGKGIGKLLAEKARELAASFSFSRMALVAVQRSHPFWSKQGFVATAVSPKIRDKLRTYSEDASYMSHEVPPNKPVHPTVRPDPSFGRAPRG